MANGTPPNPQDGRFFHQDIGEYGTPQPPALSGLVESQGRNSDKIPIFVSWPSWLEDGIVCIYAADLTLCCKRLLTIRRGGCPGYSAIRTERSAASDAVAEPDETIAEKAADPAPTPRGNTGTSPRP